MGSSASRRRATSLRSVESMETVHEEDGDEFGALPVLSVWIMDQSGGGKVGNAEGVLGHIVVRDGLSSSNSNLFTNSRAHAPLIGGGCPARSLSTVTKICAIKDERDTAMRLSVSEDEDTSSPLPRCLSTPCL
ncbi:hypothetical protein BKA70DRAFT_1418495 [Coprinopsis sp. MPI-PUGE-AT-0042]|nr:hypothetical protein BKA70DRAFT_1418495 [Coprinopsis sp. MPI-PUGE-AT-0042]